MAEKVAHILATGANVVVNRQLIYNYPESLLAAAGVLAVEHADFDGVERLARVRACCFPCLGGVSGRAFAGGAPAGAACHAPTRAALSLPP